MARYSYVILSRATPGQEQEFDRWYDEEHLGDVRRVPGVLDAQRFHVHWQDAENFEAPAWRSLAIYQIEAEDPMETVAAISAMAKTGAMQLSESLTRDGMLRLIVKPTGTEA